MADLHKFILENRLLNHLDRLLTDIVADIFAVRALKNKLGLFDGLLQELLDEMVNFSAVPVIGAAWNEAIKLGLMMIFK